MRNKKLLESIEKIYKKESKKSSKLYDEYMEQDGFVTRATSDALFKHLGVVKGVHLCLQKALEIS